MQGYHQISRVQGTKEARLTRRTTEPANILGQVGFPFCLSELPRLPDVGGLFKNERKKMKAYTDIVVVLDRSGSMQRIKEDTQHGFDAFVEQQKETAGQAKLTLVQFDTEYEFVHRGVPIQDVPKLDFRPRGLTALLDAVGKAIVETEERLAKIKKKADRPKTVVFVIITDGYENSSKEYTRGQILEMIKEKTDKQSWQFTFLAANQDAIQEAQNIGISGANAANYKTTGKSTRGVFCVMSQNVSDVRLGTKADLSYSETQRKTINEE